MEAERMTVDVSNRFIKLVKYIYLRILYGGDSYIYDIEEYILKSLLCSLSGRNKRVCCEQLKRINLFQRSPDGNIVALYQTCDPYFRAWGDILFDNKEKNFLVYEGAVCIDEGLGMCIKISVYIHRGHISSIEYTYQVNELKSRKKKSIKEINWNSVIKSDVYVNDTKLYI